MVHYFEQHSTLAPSPQHFTNPFDYTPHPLCQIAASELQCYLASKSEWSEELENGKMFGVLIVEDREQRLGYIAAFSGTLGGKNAHIYFVPPIFDILDPQGYFTREATNITTINTKIKELQNTPQYREYATEIGRLQGERDRELGRAKEALKRAKTEREKKREREELPSTEIQALNRESQHEKAEYKRLEKRLRLSIETAELNAQSFTHSLSTLKEERINRSAALQQWLFEQYIVKNAQGEEMNIASIFAKTPQKRAPAAAGECAAPKLLQYAYTHQLKPIAMAEFWWGSSPRGVVRHHLGYYPACKGKCAPILGFMLQGLDVERARRGSEVGELDIVYEDESLMVVNKGQGVLCVPGKGDDKSLYDTIKERYRDDFEPLMAHRLDMATSGLVLIAKSKEVHKSLQRQFMEGRIKKRYTALLESTPKLKEGHIKLPLSADYDHRPTQMVDYQGGKPSITRYEVTGTGGEHIKVALYPHTGRTHQLRVHCAHYEGLNSPILGDTLYGKASAERLYLHAEELTFKHPITGKLLTINCPCDF